MKRLAYRSLEWAAKRVETHLWHAHSRLLLIWVGVGHKRGEWWALANPDKAHPTLAKRQREAATRVFHRAFKRGRR